MVEPVGSSVSVKERGRNSNRFSSRIELSSVIHSCREEVSSRKPIIQFIMLDEHTCQVEVGYGRRGTDTEISVDNDSNGYGWFISYSENLVSS